MMMDRHALAMELMKRGMPHLDGGGPAPGLPPFFGPSGSPEATDTAASAPATSKPFATNPVPAPIASPVGAAVNGYTPGAFDYQNYQPVQQQGLDVFGNTNNAQNSLAQTLINQQNGEGPNPATSLLTQGQGQNAAQAAGVFANNRAINPALAARQASMIQANAGQNTANNVATLQGNQSLAASGLLNNLYNNQAAGGLNELNLGTTGNNAQNSNINTTYGISTQGALGNQANNNSLIGAGSSALGALGSAAIAAASKGGKIKGYDDGGDVTDSSPINDLSTFLAMARPMLAGGKVDGKAKVAGDNKQNDTVPTLLSPGELVVPRSKASDPEKAKDFIDHIMAKQGTTGGYGEVMAKHRELASRISEIEKRLGKKAS